MQLKTGDLVILTVEDLVQEPDTRTLESIFGPGTDRVANARVVRQGRRGTWVVRPFNVPVDLTIDPSNLAPYIGITQEPDLGDPAGSGLGAGAGSSGAGPGAGAGARAGAGAGAGAVDDAESDDQTYEPSDDFDGSDGSAMEGLASENPPDDEGEMDLGTDPEPEDLSSDQGSSEADSDEEQEQPVQHLQQSSADAWSAVQTIQADQRSKEGYSSAGRGRLLVQGDPERLTPYDLFELFMPDLEDVLEETNKKGRSIFNAQFAVGRGELLRWFGL